MKIIRDWLGRLSRLESTVLYLFCATLLIWLVDGALKITITSYLLTISLILLLFFSAALFIMSLVALLKKKKTKTAVKAKKRKR